MKKITFIIHSLKTGGSEQNCLNLFKYFKNLNYEIELIILTPAIELNIENINLVKLNSSRSIFSIFKLYKYIIKNADSTILSFSHQISLILLPLIYLRKIKLITRNINVLSLDYMYKKGIYRKIEHIIVKKLYRYCGKIICQSKGMKEDLIKNYNIKNDNIIVINNPMIEASPSDNFCQDTNYFLFVGRLEKQKNLFDLIDIFNMYKKAGGENKLKILGNGSLRTDIVRYIGKHNIPDIELVGQVKNPALYYSNADATLLTSHYEGFPNVLLESLQSGTPVISYDCQSGPSEIIIHGKNGYLVPFLDKNLFCKSLFSIKENPMLSLDIENSLKPFTLQSIGDLYREQLDEL
ncbi:glycosyltransferase [Providencia sp. PROV174]|uniref:glycosyltransferase n=1 Tax=Providencia sp. PROV174 TaxID=2949877 RepID=UPI0023491E4E|nr:glycosyltransferase [Providencia sp. PROV174]